MKNIIPLILFLLCFEIFPQDFVLINAINRASASLNGPWKVIVDPYENGYYNYRYEAFDKEEEPSRSAFFTNSKPSNKSDLIEYDFDNSTNLKVPGDWNTQDSKLFYYEGTIWYKKSFDYTKKKSSNRVFVHFGAANYLAEVYLNGQKLGKHEGGFTPFAFEVTKLLKPKDNFLIVKVDNKRKAEAVPTLNTDWWNYGGLTRDVHLVETPSTYIDDYTFILKDMDQKTIQGSVQLSGSEVANKNVSISIPELQINEEFVTNDKGSALFEFKAPGLQLWSPSDPKRYLVNITTPDDESIEKIGFRSIKAKNSSILLNGEPIFLKGICLHEESPISGGRAKNREDAIQLLSWVKELNGNFVRLAHYPHNEHMIRVADSMGVMVWEENPVYWTIQWENPKTFENAKNQLTEVIQRDKNRASVIIWSMANETPQSKARLSFLKGLSEHAKKLDSTRLISAALEQTSVEGKENVRTIDDPFSEYVDILSFNQYVGWYDGLPDKARTITWQISQNKPVLISEFGGGAKYGFHADKLTRWSEEYQKYLYQESLKMLDAIPQLAGMSPWLLVDFRSPRRLLSKIQDGYNRKGLVDEKGNKKLAFKTLQEYYAKK